MNYIYVKNSNLSKLREIIKSEKKSSTTVVLCENEKNEILPAILEEIQPTDELSITEFNGMSIGDFVNLMCQARIKGFELKVENKPIRDKIYNNLKKAYCLYFDIDEYDIPDYIKKDNEDALLTHEQEVIMSMSDTLKERIAVIQRDNPDIKIRYRTGTNYCAACINFMGKWILLRGSSIKNKGYSSGREYGEELRKNHSKHIDNLKCTDDILFPTLEILNIFVALAKYRNVTSYWGTLTSKIEISEDKIKRLSEQGFDVLSISEQTGEPIDKVYNQITKPKETIAALGGKALENEVIKLAKQGLNYIQIADKLHLENAIVSKIFYDYNLFNKESTHSLDTTLDVDKQIVILHENKMTNSAIAQKLNIPINKVTETLFREGRMFEWTLNGNPYCQWCSGKTTKHDSRGNKKRYLCSKCGKYTSLPL